MIIGNCFKFHSILLVCILLASLVSAYDLSTIDNVIKEANNYLLDEGLSINELPNNSLLFPSFSRDVTTRGTQYSDVANKLFVNIDELKREDLILHEYGHVVIDSLYYRFPLLYLPLFLAR